MIYALTKKGISKSNLTKNDRLIFTKSNEAILYDCESLEIIEPFFIKSKDSYIYHESNNIPQHLIIVDSLVRMYPNKIESLKITLEKLSIKPLYK